MKLTPEIITYVRKTRATYRGRLFFAACRLAYPGLTDNQIAAILKS